MTFDLQNPASPDRDVEQRLATLIDGLHMPSLRRVHVAASREELLLRGEVHSFYAKQVLEHAAQLVADHRQIVSEVSVAPGRLVRSRSIATRAGMLLTAVTLALTAGCGKSEPQRAAVNPVSGQVLFNGKPAAGAFVVFHPADRSEKYPPPTAQVDAQGNYSLGTYVSGDGAPTGEYIVTVVLRKVVEKDGEFTQGPNLLPPKYSKPATSKIAARVTDGSNAIPIKITR